MREFKFQDSTYNNDIVHQTHHVEHTDTDTPRTHQDTCTNGAREDDGGKLWLKLELRSRTADVRGRSGARSPWRSPASAIELSILPAILDAGEPPGEPHTYACSSPSTCGYRPSGAPATDGHPQTLGSTIYPHPTMRPPCSSCELPKRDDILASLSALGYPP